MKLYSPSMVNNRILSRIWYPLWDIVNGQATMMVRHKARRQGFPHNAILEPMREQLQGWRRR